MLQNQRSNKSFPEGIKSSILTGAEISELYRILKGNSELSESTIDREMGTALKRLDQGRHFLAADIRDIGLGMEEMAFIIEHNRYQEKSAPQDEISPRIDVRGTFGDRHMFFISEDAGLSSRVHEDIVNLIRRNPAKATRLFAYRIKGPGGESDTRVLYLLSIEERMTGPAAGDSAKDAAAIYTGAEGMNLSAGEIKIIVEDPHEKRAGNPSEKCVRIWVSRERFLDHFGTIHRVFERQGLPFIREYAACFKANGSEYAAMTVYLSSELIGAEVSSFLQSELYNRLLPLKPAPVPVSEIRDLLRDIAAMDDYRKPGLIDMMQHSRRKEYLVPLVVLLGESSPEIRSKAFGLIKNYLLNPTPEMKNDYYWCTLNDILSAASVPFEREKDREPRPLTDDEIIQLIRFSGVHFEEYTEPLTGRQFLFIRMTGCGIGKGGIRAHESHVSFSSEGALSTNMLFKTMGIGIPFYAAGKGGILGDTSFREDDESLRGEARRNVFRAYADFIYFKAGIGPLTDVPAGDVGVGGAEIGIMFDRITDNVKNDAAAASGPEKDMHGARRLRRNFGIASDDPRLMARISSDRDTAAEYAAPSITGKPGEHGLALRAGATGRGMVEVLAAQRNYRHFNDASLWRDPLRVEEALAADGEFTRLARENISMLTFAIQGFGKVGASFARLIDEMGSAITMISDVSGTIAHGRRIPDIAGLCSFCSAGNRMLSDVPRDLLGDSEFIPGNTVLPLTAVVNVVVPSALEDVIVTIERPEAGCVSVNRLACEYVLQGANGPVTCDAEDVLAGKGIISFPDILANSGGVLASYCEWLNGLIRLNGYASVYGHGFVHPIVHNMVTRLHRDAVSGDIRNIDEEAYRRAFRFILRQATISTIELSHSCRIPMKTAYLALGIRGAAEEGRLTERFSFTMAKIRDGFSEGLTPAG